MRLANSEEHEKRQTKGKKGKRNNSDNETDEDTVSKPDELEREFRDRKDIPVKVVEEAKIYTTIDKLKFKDNQPERKNSENSEEQFQIFSKNISSQKTLEQGDDFQIPQLYNDLLIPIQERNFQTSHMNHLEKGVASFQTTTKALIL